MSTYVRDRVCWDADSHLMPRADFLSRHTEEKYRDALWIGGGEAFAKWFGKIIGEVDERLADPPSTTSARTSRCCSRSR